MPRHFAGVGGVARGMICQCFGCLDVALEIWLMVGRRITPTWSRTAISC